MPDLAHTLQDRDLGFLRIVAEAWGLDLIAPDVHSAQKQVITAICDPGLLQEGIESLPPETRGALAALQRSGGKIPWPEFTRSFGAVREMGPAKRDRERPHLHPVSPAEVLWYRALLGRGFFDTPTGPLEFAYLPDDLVEQLPPVQTEGSRPPGIPAQVDGYAHIQPADDRILDQACTLLAALRLGRLTATESIPSNVLQDLLRAAGLLDDHNVPLPEPTRLFLEASRGEALAQLFNTWRQSKDFNELRLLPGLICEGQWRNDPLTTRTTLLNFVQQVPAETWWDLEEFVSAIHQLQPDYQRSGGDYDSWFIRQESSGQFLRGFEHWDDIDGSLIRFLICGPLHWLGVTDLGSATEQANPAAFRFSKFAPALLSDGVPDGLRMEEGKLRLFSDGRVSAPRLTPRAVRYQVARFCSWEEPQAGEFRYRITPTSLERARKQGLRSSHLLSLLRRYAAAPPVPSLVRAIERWDELGAQATFEQLIVLRVKSPDILAALRKSRAARFLGEPLGPTAVIVQPGAREKVAQVLIELGYLAEAGFAEEKEL